MKPNFKRLTAIIFLLAFVGMLEVANAFYDPGLQRWVIQIFLVHLIMMCLMFMLLIRMERK